MKNAVISEEEISCLGMDFENRIAEEVIAWGLDTFGGDIVLACSFGAEDVALVDMIVKIEPEANIFYLDTNKHFPETYETRDRLAQKYGIQFMQILPRLTLEEQAKKHGDFLWRTNPDLCCQIRKVDPLKQVLAEYSAWITGIRRDQTPMRANAKKVEWDSNFGLVKLNPLADWTSNDVWRYIIENDVPYNPLHDRFYPSIGCSVCTRPVKPRENPRAGRWRGFAKTECGLHKGKSEGLISGIN